MPETEISMNDLLNEIRNKVEELLASIDKDANAGDILSRKTIHAARSVRHHLLILDDKFGD